MNHFVIGSEAYELPSALMRHLERISRKNDCSLKGALLEVLEAGLEKLDDEWQESMVDRFGIPLSPKQKVVMICLRRGMAVKEIASDLGVSETTIRTHIARLKQRMDCDDLLQLRLPARS